MHASRLVELAAISARNHVPLLQQEIELASRNAEQFWVFSRSRVIEWSRRLKACQELRNLSGDFEAERFWLTARPLVEEVFLAEVCTRVWCATLSIFDDQRAPGEFDPISRSVHIASLEARRRALRLLLFARGLNGIETGETNRLRRDCELWTDLLLARVGSQPIARLFCFERARFCNLARQHRSQRSAIQQTDRFEADLFEVRFGLTSRQFGPSVCDELNGEIAAVILGSQPLHAFDGVGIPRPAMSFDSFQTDMLSVDVLQDLCGNSTGRRYDVPGGLTDRR